MHEVLTLESNDVAKHQENSLLVAGYFRFPSKIQFEPGERIRFEACFLSLHQEGQEVKFSEHFLSAFKNAHYPDVVLIPRTETPHNQPVIDFSCGPVYKEERVEHSARCAAQFFSMQFEAPMILFKGEEVIEVYFKGKRMLPPPKKKA